MRIVFTCAEKSPARLNTFNAVRSMVLASGLPYEPAKVNKNWPRLAYGPAPSMGVRAEREYLDIYLLSAEPIQKVREALEQAKPQGLTLLDVQRVPYALPSVQNLAAAAVYRVEGNFDLFAPDMTAEDFFNAARVDITRRADNGLALVQNAKPYIWKAQTVSNRAVRLTLLNVQGKWERPQTLIAAWLGIDIPAQDEAFTVEGFTFIRESFLWQDSEGEFHPI
ncbi:DUF2344 domain-containing protein [Candidatus Avelusimicrobium stercoris]|uniref:DUF2344 domain-containing protein n=1 Tax=Candidatus Avelusimicrobium stercoris TaxID=1947924 RepID=UPI003D147E0C